MGLNFDGIRFGGGIITEALKEMLTPKDEHFVPPVSTGVMFDGRISFDGIATVKNFGSWILFPNGPPVKRKSGAKFSVVTHSRRVTCRYVHFWLIWRGAPKAWFSTSEFQSKANKTGSLCSDTGAAKGAG
jgi:hypothetical protein